MSIYTITSEYPENDFILKFRVTQTCTKLVKDWCKTMISKHDFELRFIRFPFNRH